MYRIIIFTIQLLILLTILTFIFSNPFIISLDINNLKYTFSSNILFGILIFLLFLIYISNYFIFKSRMSLKKYFINNKFKRIEKGYQHFVDGMISIANKDYTNASKSYKKMKIYLSYQDQFGRWIPYQTICFKKVLLHKLVNKVEINMVP